MARSITQLRLPLSPDQQERAKLVLDRAERDAMIWNLWNVERTKPKYLAALFELSVGRVNQIINREYYRLK